MPAAVTGPATGGVASAPPTVDGGRDPWPWFGPLMLAMGVAFVVVTLAGLSVSTRLAEQGVPVTATIVAKYTLPAESGRQFRVTYAFATADGEARTDDEAVSQARFDALEVGAPLAVVYLAEDPSISGLAPYATPPAVMWLSALALSVLSFAVGAWYTMRGLSTWMERRA